MENNEVRYCGLCKFYYPVAVGVPKGVCTVWQGTVLDQGEISADDRPCGAFKLYRDPAPDHDQKDQRHSARWKGAGLGEYSCSWCGEVVCGSSHNFCPFCGSFMNPAPDSEVSDGE